MRYVYFGSLFAFIVFVHIWIGRFLSIYKRNSLFDRIEFIIYLFDEIKELMYQKLWREEILIQITSGYNFDPNESYTFRDRYIKLVVGYCGRNVLNDLLDIYGDLDALTVNIGNCFMIKIDKHFTELGIDVSSDKVDQIAGKTEK